MGRRRETPEIVAATDLLWRVNHAGTVGDPRCSCGGSGRSSRPGNGGPFAPLVSPVVARCRCMDAIADARHLLGVPDV